jgi:hypothetical protein
MRLETQHGAPPQHPPKSLAIRGGLTRTFGGLATFLVLTLIFAPESTFSRTTLRIRSRRKR